MMGGVTAMLETSPPGVLAADLSACAAYGEATAAAAAVSCPVTLVLGSQDRIDPPKGGTGTRGGLHPASLHPSRSATSGHMLMLEEPAAVRQAILDHLAAC